MGKKPKARGSPRKAETKIEDPAQSERFIETAREIGADESPGHFERAFTKMVPKKAHSKTE